MWLATGSRVGLRFSKSWVGFNYSAWAGSDGKPHSSQNGLPSLVSEYLSIQWKKKHFWQAGWYMLNCLELYMVLWQCRCRSTKVELHTTTQKVMCEQGCDLKKAWTWVSARLTKTDRKQERGEGEFWGWYLQHRRERSMGIQLISIWIKFQQQEKTGIYFRACCWEYQQ